MHFWQRLVRARSRTASPRPLYKRQARTHGLSRAARTGGDRPRHLVAVDLGDGALDVRDVVLVEGLVEADEAAVLAARVLDVRRLAVEARLDGVLRDISNRRAQARGAGRTLISLQVTSPPQPSNLSVTPLTNGISFSSITPWPSSFCVMRILCPRNSRNTSFVSSEAVFEDDFPLAISRKASNFLEDITSRRWFALLPVRPFSLIFISQ